MTSFFYPTQADNGHEWFAKRLDEWHDSGKKRFCFPFMSFTPHTLPKTGDFWMYMYYRQGKTDIEELKGKVKFRVHVTEWGYTQFQASDTYDIDFGGGETVWFLCDKAEEIRTAAGGMLGLYDFAHRDGKQLYSTVRTSIAPVICLEEKNIKPVIVYPERKAP